MLTQEEKQLMKEFIREVRWLKTQKIQEKQQQWVKVTEIVELTGWNKEDLRRARANGLVQWKRDDGIWYDLLSLNPLFIKKQVS